MLHIVIPFLTHWFLFCFVTNLARLLLVKIKYPISCSIKDVIILTRTTAVMSGVLHAVGFIWFEKYAVIVFNALHYIRV